MADAEVVPVWGRTKEGLPLGLPAGLEDRAEERVSQSFED